MPLPWKKARVTRISRLVAGLQSPPKHGGSLVVETGFPTSLIDLFVKNRDRLKKPSSRNKKRLQISDPVTLSAPPLDLRMNDNSPPPPSPASDGFWGSTVSRIETLGCRNYKEQAYGVDASGSVDTNTNNNNNNNNNNNQGVGGGGGEEGGVGGGSKATGVFVAIMKMFVVVVLALGTKKLAVGITMSAFVLLLLECLGTRVVWFLKPSSHMQMTLRSFWIKRVSPFVSREQKVLMLEEKGGTKVLNHRQDEVGDSECRGLIGDLKSSEPIEEIEIVEPNLNFIAPTEKIQSLKPDLDMLNRDRRWGYRSEINEYKRIVEKDEDGVEVSEHRNRRNHSAKLKSKILKKIVPKKFHGLKKGKKSKEKEREKESSSEVLSYMGQDKLGRCEEKEQKEDGEGQVTEDEDVKSSISPLEKEERGEEEEEEEVDEGISSSGEIAKLVTGTAIVSEKVGRETERNSGYLILVLIVLAGLVGGRVLALFLIIAWCFMLKSVGTLRRFTNVPMIKFRSPV